MIKTNRLAKLRNGHVLTAAAFLMPPLAVYAPLGLAPLHALTALVVLAVAYLRDRSIAPISLPFAGVLGALVAWGALSSLWSVDPGHSLRKSFQLLVVFAGALVLAGAARRLSADERIIVGKALVVGICLSLAVYVFEIATDAALLRLVRGIAETERLKYSHFNKGLSVLALGLWPAAMMLWRFDRKPGAALLTLAGALIISLYYGRAMTIAFAGGVVVFAIVLAFPKRATLVLAALVAAGVALAPALPKTILAPEKVAGFTADLEDKLAFRSFLNLEFTAKSIAKRSGFRRLLIWEATADKIMERPILGWGLRSSRFVPGTKGLRSSRSVPGTKKKSAGLGIGGEKRGRSALHPHNAPLQWWLELGIPGAALGAGFLVLMIATIHRHVSSRLDRAFCLGQLTVALVIASLSFGAWQSWWLSTFALTATLTLVVQGLAPAGPGGGGVGGAQGARGPGRRPA